MDDKQRNLALVIMGGIVTLIGLLSLLPLVYLEATHKGTVSLNLAGLVAIPLGVGAAMIKTAFNPKDSDKDKSENNKEKP